MAKSETRGRPTKPVDASIVQGMAAVGCTTQDIATALNVSPDTIERRFMAELERGRQQMRQSLRKKQFESAMSGNVTMLIWLGKQHLGQVDKQELSGSDEAPVTLKYIIPEPSKTGDK